MVPNLKVGDEIVLVNMLDEFGVIPGTKGVVKDITEDPFEKGNYIIYVNWKNGSSLSLLSNHDKWKKVKKDIQENAGEALQKIDPHTYFLAKNQKLRKSIDLPFFMDYLKKVRESGIVNMLSSSSFVYQDAKHMERYYGEGREDNEEFQELLRIQDDVKNKFIQGLLDYAQKNGIELSDNSKINSLAQKISKSILEYYILFFN
jgi:hypothetical protein